MTLQGELLELAIRYYHWALEQWNIEFAEDYPVLRAVNAGSMAISAIRVMQRLPAETRVEVARAMVKRCHFHAAGALGELASQADEELACSFFGACHQEGERLEREGKVRNPITRTVPLKQVRALLRKELPKALEPVLGSRPRRYHLEHAWSYETFVGHWKVFTDIDLDGRIADLRYKQIIFAAPIGQFVSGLTWLGLSGSGTEWSNLTLEEVPTAVANLAWLCQRFLEAAPRILPT